MSFAPQAPSVRVAPQQIAPDTYVIHSVQEALGAPLAVYLNSMVILGEEPVIVDTGTIANRAQFLDDVFGLVDPKDVKWVFLSHDDIDHTGNLEEVMELAVNATVVANWAMVERHANAFEWPLNRLRWVGDGESFDAGDRRLVAVRPPAWDSPTTRGLFDTSTGVYWGVDSFATPMPGGPVANVNELDPQFWADGVAMFLYNALSPWLSLVDHDKFRAHVDAVQALGMHTIASAHSPLITAESIDQAFAIVRELPARPAPPVPDQNILDQIVSATAVA